MRSALLLAFLVLAACSSTPPKVASEVCGNGADDDGNGKVDCADPACAARCPGCGDGARDEGEACDGADLGAASCETRGFTGGELACTSTCTLDESGCTRAEDCAAAGDEDGDGQADCDDDVCALEPSCRRLDVVTAPPATGVITSTFGLTLRVVDGAGQPVAGAEVTSHAFPGGQIAPPKLTTADDGLVSFQGRRAAATGEQRFRFVPDAGAELEVATTAVAPEPLTVITVLNADHEEGTATSGPALSARVGKPQELAVDDDGTLYVAEACRLLRVGPDGELALLGGGGDCTGDPGAALEPGDPLSITGLALDGRGGLYLSDPGAAVVRRLDLATSELEVVAGGGEGDPGAANAMATAVELDRPGEIARDPTREGAFYFVDGARLLEVEGGRIRVALQASSACEAQEVALQTCNGGCRPLLDAGGIAFLAGGLCGSGPKPAGGPSAVSGLLRLEAGEVVHAAGLQGGAAEGVPSWLAGFFGRLRPAFDLGGNLLAFSSSRLLRIDARSQRTHLLIADNTPGFEGDAAPLAAARFSSPEAIAVDARGDVWVADTGNFAVRRIVGLGDRPPDQVRVEVVTDSTPVFPAQRLASGAQGALAARVTDGQGAPLAGQRVIVRALQPGAHAYPVAATDGQGEVRLDVRAGLALGRSAFRVDLPGLRGAGTPAAADLDVDVVPPGAGTVFAALGADGVTPGVFPDAPLAGPAAPVAAFDVALAGERGLLVAAACRLYLMSPQGELSVLAGTGGCSNIGDGGPAVSASLTAANVAYDPARQRVYVSAGYLPDLVRSIDLATGEIARFAGGNEAGGPGDGGPALDAVLGPVVDLDVAPDGRVVIVEQNRLRSVDPGTGIIETHLVADASFPCAPEDEGELGGFVAGAADGDHLVVSAEACTIDLPLPQSVLDVSRDGSFVNLGGRRGGSDEDGIPLADAEVFVTGFTHDLQGNLVFADGGRIRVIDRATGVVHTLAGDWHGVTGDYVPAIDALFDGARDVSIDGQGHVWFVDRSVRLIW